MYISLYHSVHYLISFEQNCSSLKKYSKIVLDTPTSLPHLEGKSYIPPRLLILPQEQQQAAFLVIFFFFNLSKHLAWPFSLTFCLCCCLILLSVLISSSTCVDLLPVARLLVALPLRPGQWGYQAGPVSLAVCSFQATPHPHKEPHPNVSPEDKNSTYIAWDQGEPSSKCSILHGRGQAQVTRAKLPILLRDALSAAYRFSFHRTKSIW